MAETCYRCGNTEADTYRYCSHRKAFVCVHCESACPNYSSKLLPNGTNCRLKYMSPMNKMFQYLCNSQEVKEAKVKYRVLPVNLLKERYKEFYQKHNGSGDSGYRSLLRVELAAIQEVLEERGCA